MGLVVNQKEPFQLAWDLACFAAHLQKTAVVQRAWQRTAHQAVLEPVVVSQVVVAPGVAVLQQPTALAAAKPAQGQAKQSRQAGEGEPWATARCYHLVVVAVVHPSAGARFAREQAEGKPPLPLAAAAECPA